MEPKKAEELAKYGQTEPLNGDYGFGDRIEQIKKKMADKGINLSTDDLDALEAYLISEQKWEEVYRRLADS